MARLEPEVDPEPEPEVEVVRLNQVHALDGRRVDRRAPRGRRAAQWHSERRRAVDERCRQQQRRQNAHRVGGQGDRQYSVRNGGARGQGFMSHLDFI